MRMLTHVSVLLYDNKKLLSMFGMDSWLIVWHTSDPSKKSDSLEQLSHMDGAGSGGGKAVSAGGPMELMAGGSWQSIGGGSNAQVEATQLMVLWRDAAMSLLLVSSTQGSYHGTEEGAMAVWLRCDQGPVCGYCHCHCHWVPERP